MQRSQMHILAARRQRRVGENRLIRIGRESLNGRRRGILAAKMQPSLDILGPAGQSAQHSAGLVRWRRDGRDRHRGGLRRRSLDGRGRNARGGRRTLLLRVGHGDLHYRRRRLGAVVENDLLRRGRQRVWIARILVAREDRILAAVSVNQANGLDAGRGQFGDLGLVLFRLFRDQRLDRLRRA